MSPKPIEEIQKGNSIKEKKKNLLKPIELHHWAPVYFTICKFKKKKK